MSCTTFYTAGPILLAVILKTKDKTDINKLLTPPKLSIKDFIPTKACSTKLSIPIKKSSSIKASYTLSVAALTLSRAASQPSA
jgi:hypothetical protein